LGNLWLVEIRLDFGVGLLDRKIVLRIARLLDQRLGLRLVLDGTEAAEKLLGRFVLDFTDTVFEIETVSGDFAGWQRRLDCTQLRNEGTARLLIDRPAIGPGI